MSIMIHGVVLTSLEQKVPKNFQNGWNPTINHVYTIDSRGIKLYVTPLNKQCPNILKTLRYPSINHIHSCVKCDKGHQMGLGHKPLGWSWHHSRTGSPQISRKKVEIPNPKLYNNYIFLFLGSCTYSFTWYMYIYQMTNWGTSWISRIKNYQVWNLFNVNFESWGSPRPPEMAIILLLESSQSLKL